MGWEDRHLHVFRFSRLESRKAIELGIPDSDLPVGEDSVLPDWEHAATEFFTEPGASCVYEYDFGDGWEHDILIEKIQPPEPGQIYPRCLAGKRACPPEDVGGIWGYDEALESLKDPTDSEHASWKAWFPEGFDAAAFDLDQVNEALTGKAGT